MIKLILFTVVISLVGAITDPTHLCDELMTLNCKTSYIPGEKDEIVCGTNGVTYDNFCYYGQARCNDKTITVKTVGSCSAVVTSTMAPATASTRDTPATAPVVMSTVTTVPTTRKTTADPLLEAFCSNKNSIACGTDLSPICGSDKQFYLNKCEYSKAYCDDKTLSSKSIEFCTGGAGRK